MFIKGHKRSKETQEKISKALKGRPCSEERKRKIGDANRGRKCAPMSSEIKEKISKTMKTIKQSEEHKRNISKGLKDKGIRPPSRKGVKYPLEYCLGKRGEKSPNWHGGKSFESYTIDWTNTLRQSIRERDKYVCQICGGTQGDRAHHVHHIDYDKKNCNPINLVTLCAICHTKTNATREKWIEYFKLRGQLCLG